MFRWTGLVTLFIIYPLVQIYIYLWNNASSSNLAQNTQICILWRDSEFTPRFWKIKNNPVMRSLRFKRIYLSGILVYMNVHGLWSQLINYFGIKSKSRFCGFLVYSYFLSLIVEKHSQTNLMRKLKSRMGRSLQTSHDQHPVHQIALAQAFMISVPDINSNKFVKMFCAFLKLIISMTILYSLYVVLRSF